MAPAERRGGREGGREGGKEGGRVRLGVCGVKEGGRKGGVRGREWRDGSVCVVCVRGGVGCPPRSLSARRKGRSEGGREGGAAGASTYLQGHGQSGRPRAPSGRDGYVGGGEW